MKDYFAALVLKFKNWFNSFVEALVEAATPATPPIPTPITPPAPDTPPKPTTTPIPDTPPTTPVPPPAPVINQQPWGMDSKGNAYPGPAYAACRRMVEAGQVAGKINPFEYILGLQPLSEKPVYPPKFNRMLDLENEVVALGVGSWGQEWISHDENCTQIGAYYQRLFTAGLDPKFPNGYVVKRKSNNPDDGFIRVVQ